jgi:hypothetical protein
MHLDRQVVEIQGEYRERTAPKAFSILLLYHIGYKRRKVLYEAKV